MDNSLDEYFSFTDGTEGWSSPGTGSISNNNQKLNLSVINKWGSTSKYFYIDPSKPVRIEFDFENGDMVNPIFFVREQIGGVWEPGANRDVFNNLEDGHHVINLSLTGDYIQVYFEKGGGSDNGTQTTCYFDNFKIYQNTLEVVEESNYYPFGLKHKGYNETVSPLGNSIAQRWKFGGKEFDESLNLDTYDFGARNYDPTLGRWMNIDPLAEEMRRHSPYNYAYNSPIFFFDPDGMMPQGPCGDKPCPEKNFFQRAANSFTEFFEGVNKLIDNQTFGKNQTNIELANSNVGIDRLQIVSSQLGGMTEAMNQSSDAAADGVKGSIGVIAELTDAAAESISETSNSATILSGGASSPLTVPLAKGADAVATGSKIVKGSIHASDGNDEAAKGEFADAAASIVSARIVKNVSKHVKKMGGMENETQKDVQESVFTNVMNWFRSAFED